MAERPASSSRKEETGSPSSKTTLKKHASVKDVLKRRSTVKFNGQGGFLHELSDEQRKTMEKVREAVKGEDYPEKSDADAANKSPFVLDDACLLRFLRARGFNGFKATSMLREHLAFRRQWRPHEITADDPKVKQFLDSGVWSVLGYTKNNHPLELVRFRLFKPEDYTVDEFTRCIIYTREFIAGKLLESAGAPKPDADDHDFMLQERTMVLFDASEWSIFQHGTPLAMRQMRVLVEALQSHWPETLGVAAIVNAPATFRWAFAIIKRWMDEETASRMSYVTHADELRELIDPTVLPRKYGGEADDPTEPAAAAAPAMGNGTSTTTTASEGVGITQAIMGRATRLTTVASGVVRKSVRVDKDAVGSAARTKSGKSAAAAAAASAAPSTPSSSSGATSVGGGGSPRMNGAQAATTAVAVAVSAGGEDNVKGGE